MGKEGALAFALAAMVGLGVWRAVPASPAERLEPDARGLSSGARRVLGLPIDINLASAGELEALPGVGPALAARIVAFRQAHGRFATLDEVERVPGIGPGKLRLLQGRAAVLAER